MKKMNNKGFSLVELIVVVLIMAIIAVALAPQVMKWVDNSRRSTDEDNYNEMIANAQVALTDKDAYAAVYDAANASTVKYHFYIDNNGTKLYKGSGTSSDVTSTTTDPVQKAMTAVSANWSSIKAKVSLGSGVFYGIDLYGDGSVRKDTAHMPALNADLS